MGQHTKPDNKSRRWFLSFFLPAKDSNTPPEMVKMLTADGKLVEVEKSVFDKAQKQKTTNKDIMEWMDNPSKDF